MKCIDLFCGAGGFSLGLHRAGWETMMAVDSWKWAVDAYNANQKPIAAQLDMVADFDSLVELGRTIAPDAIVGGPPCQDFSKANCIDSSKGERAELTPMFAEYIAAVKPEWFVMENVRTAAPYAAYVRAHEILHAAGYATNLRLYRAEYHGCPQKRRRLIMIGRLGGLPSRIALGAPRASQPLSMRQYFEEAGHPLKFDVFYRSQQFDRKSVFSVDAPSPTIVGQDEPPNKRTVENEFDCGDFRTAPMLTMRQRAMVQTFPPDYKWPDSKRIANKLIGNALPPNLAEAIGRLINQPVDDEIPREGMQLDLIPPPDYSPADRVTTRR